METRVTEENKQTGGDLSSERREDTWALLLAMAVLILSMAAPETVHEFFKELLFVF